MDALSIFVLAIVSVFLGCASATIAVSSYSLLLPILLVYFGLGPLDGLLVCFIADAVNGLLLFVYHRRKLEPWQTKVVLAGSVLCGITAPVSAVWFGIDFLSAHSSGFKSSNCFIVLAMGIGFLIKYRNLRRKHLDAVAALEGNDPEAVLSGTSVQAELVEPMLGEGANETRAIAPDDYDEPLSHFEDEPPGPESAPPFGAKEALSVLAVFVMSVIAGVIGFTGGNAFAIIFIQFHRWGHLASTGSGGAMSSALATGMLVAYLADGAASLGSLSMYVAVSLPSTIVGVIVSSHLVKNVTEHNMNLIVALVFIFIGLTTFTLGILK